MDWKRWYRDEVESDAGRDAVAAAIARWPDGDLDLRRALRAGGAASFPHTSLRGSADPLARVATSILAEGFRRVVALGVLHGSTAPESSRPWFAAATHGDAEAMRRVGGAFTVGAEAATPFGSIAAGPTPKAAAWVRRDDALLEHEFSLDLFLATLAAAAKRRPTGPPAITRLFVGPTIVDGHAVPVIASIADALRPLLGADTALVATGDLVHAGNGYSADAEIEALPAQATGMASHFRDRTRRMLDDALAGGERLREADTLARELRSDQRHVLPVIAALLGAGARARLLSFELTDYGPILGQPPPCVVASTLVAFEPAASRR